MRVKVLDVLEINKDYQLSIQLNELVEFISSHILLVQYCFNY